MNRAVGAVVLAVAMSATVHAKEDRWQETLDAGITARESGDFGEAEKRFREALKGATKGDVRSAQTLHEIARLHFIVGKNAAAEKGCRRAIEIFEFQQGRHDHDLAQALTTLAFVEMELDRHHDAKGHVEQALALFKKTGPEGSAAALLALSRLHLLRDQHQEALPLVQQAIALLEKRGESPDLGHALGQLASIYGRQKRYPQAEPPARKAIAILERAYGADYEGLSAPLDVLAKCRAELAKGDETEKLYRRAIEVKKKARGEEHVEVAALMNNLALFHLERRDTAQAEPLLRRAIEIREKVLGDEHASLVVPFHNLGALMVERGALDKADALFRRALAIAERPNVEVPVDTLVVVLRSLARVCDDTKRRDEGDLLRKRALAAEEKRSLAKK